MSGLNSITNSAATKFSPTINYDLMFIVDDYQTVYSFNQFLKTFLPQILYIIQLTNLFSNVKILSFQDLSDTFMWEKLNKIHNFNILSNYIYNFKSKIGCENDELEFLKMAIKEAIIKINKPTIGILLTNSIFACHKIRNKRKKKEEEFQETRKFNWLNLFQEARRHNLRIFSIVSEHYNDFLLFYSCISNYTYGSLINISNYFSLVHATIGIILNISGIEFEYDDNIIGVTLSSETDIQKLLKGVASYDDYCLFYSKPEILSIDCLKNKACKYVDRFNEYPDFQNLVFEIFEQIITTENIIFLTYNTIFIQLWRVILIIQKEDNRANAIFLKFKAFFSQSNFTIRRKLNFFVNGLYNRNDEIDKIITISGNNEPFYVLDKISNDISRSKLFELCFSCSSKTILILLNNLKNIKISKTRPNGDINFPYLPINLKRKTIFQLISHLICQGTMLNSRLAPIMAILSIISGSILQKKAISYLEEVKGKWINNEFLIHFSLNFIRLLMQVSELAFTEKEKEKFNSLILIRSLKLYNKKYIKVEVGYLSLEVKKMDSKEKCKKCSQWRSITQLLDDMCVICCEYQGINPPDMDKMASFMCECINCSVNCVLQNNYSEFLCRFCLSNRETPFVKCIKCNTKFMYQKSLPLNNFTCEICKYDKNNHVHNHTVTIKDYINQNNTRFLGINIKNTNIFFDDLYFINKLIQKDEILSIYMFSEISEKDFLNHKLKVKNITYKVLNVKDVQKQIFAIFKGIEIQKCKFCNFHFLKNYLYPICNENPDKCNANACFGCLKEYYKGLKLGMEVVPDIFYCYFCKNTPSLQHIKNFNILLGNAMEEFSIKDYNLEWIYGWCTKCVKITKVMPRINKEPDQVISNFRCDTCKWIRLQIEGVENILENL